MSTKASPRAVSGTGEQQLTRLRAEIAAVVARKCPPWLAAQADDIAQAALLRVTAAVGEGDPPPGPSYLRKAVFCAVIDEIRRVRARREAPLDESADVVDTRTVSPEEAAAGRQFGRGIQDCLAALPETRRRALTLHLLGHTVPEVARLLGWDEKRAENLVYRGLADLRGCLRAKGHEP